MLEDGRELSRCCGRACCRRRPASPLACLATCALVLAYNLLGGFLFLALEGGTAAGGEESAVAASKPNLSRARELGADLRGRTVERLWSITEDLNILYKENWTSLAARELLDFQQVLVRSLRAPAASPAAAAPRPHHRWTFATSFLYALTLITTIGHGNVTPRSAVGKLAAVAYACVGIPLVMLYLSAVGEAAARRLRAAYARCRPGRRAARACPPAAGRTPFQAALNLASLGAARRRCREPARVPAALSALLLALYVALGALLFRATEDWDLVDGCFFSFSSLATIGFGELRPGRSAAAEDVALGLCCLYILVGIVVVAMCFNLMQEELGAALRRLCGAGRAAAVHSARDDKAAAAS